MATVETTVVVFCVETTVVVFHVETVQLEKVNALLVSTLLSLFKCNYIYLQLFIRANMEGFQPEWCVSAMIYSGVIPF